MNSDGKTLNIKVVELQKLWNFVVHNFFIWNHLRSQNMVCIYQIWNKFKIQILQITSDEKTLNIKIVDL